jgi:uncharacterized beta-barrel protein YwiB (DUF1934 family)
MKVIEKITKEIDMDIEYPFYLKIKETEYDSYWESLKVGEKHTIIIKYDENGLSLLLRKTRIYEKWEIEKYRDSSQIFEEYFPDVLNEFKQINFNQQ